jgi:hypothetical protein
MLIMKKQFLFLSLLVLPVIGFSQSIEILPGNDGKGNIISNSGAFPTMHMFPGGTLNPDKMVISHSTAYSNFGLQYRDAVDMFVFTGNGFPNLTIDLGTSVSSVKVGVGTDVPDETFHVMGDTRLESANPMLFLRKTGSTGMTGTEFQSSAGTMQAFVGFDDDNNLLRLSYGSTVSDEFVIESSGNVGINTNDPIDQLHVFGGDVVVEDTYPYTRYYKTNTIGQMGNLFYEGSPAAIKGFIGFDTNDEVLRMSNGSTSFDHLTIKSNGYVGLGTDDASQKLNVVNGSILLESGTTDRVSIQYSGASAGGEVTLYTSDGTQSVEIRGSDGVNKAGEILFYDPTTNAKTLEIDGDWAGSGKSRIVTDELEIKGGSDFAEYFDVLKAEVIQPGMVLSALPDGSGKLAVSTDSYDKKVVGIVSGANGVSTGLMLRQKGNEAVDGSHPIAISGRVYVYADAAYGDIKVGDLLTTSATAGHVMKCKSSRKGRGATVGKALSNLTEGRGFVLVLLDSK